MIKNGGDGAEFKAVKMCDKTYRTRIRKDFWLCWLGISWLFLTIVRCPLINRCPTMHLYCTPKILMMLWVLGERGFLLREWTPSAIKIVLSHWVVLWKVWGTQRMKLNAFSDLSINLYKNIDYLKLLFVVPKYLTVLNTSYV